MKMAPVEAFSDTRALVTRRNAPPTKPLQATTEATTLQLPKLGEYAAFLVNAEKVRFPQNKCFF